MKEQNHQFIPSLIRFRKLILSSQYLPGSSFMRHKSPLEDSIVRKEQVSKRVESVGWLSNYVRIDLSFKGWIYDVLICLVYDLINVAAHF